MPLRRAPGPPDLERVAAVLAGTSPAPARPAGTSPGPARPGWVPGPPPARDEEGDERLRPGVAAVRPLPAAEPAQPDPDVAVAALDAELRVARRPHVFTIPEQLRSGRLAVSSAAVVAVLALVVALGCAFAVRVLWAERSAGIGPQPPLPPRGTVSVVRSSPDTTAPVQGTNASLPGGRAPSGAPPSAAGAAGVVVHVVGQVKHPGLVRLGPGSRVADAIAAAGGATRGADLTLLNLARLVVDGEQVLVPRPGEALPPVAGAPAGGPGATGSGSGAGGLVNLNTADLAALDTLPGVGPVLAQRIIDWRAEHGRFTSVEELGEVSGIGEKLFAQIRPKVTV